MTHLSKGLIETIRLEDRIVAKTASAVLLLSDMSVAAALEEI